MSNLKDGYDESDARKLRLAVLNPTTDVWELAENLRWAIEDGHDELAILVITVANARGIFQAVQAEAERRRKGLAA